MSGGGSGSGTGSLIKNANKNDVLDGTDGTDDLNDPLSDVGTQKKRRMTLNKLKQRLESAAKNVQECMDGIDADCNILNESEAKLQTTTKENEDLKKKVIELEAQISELKKNEGKAKCLECDRVVDTVVFCNNRCHESNVM